MRKSKLFSIVAFATILVFLTGCSKGLQAADVDWEHVIRNDFFVGESVVEQAMEETKSFVVVEHNRNQLAITVNAPDICEGLMEWIESVSGEEFAEWTMEQEILRLLQETPKTEIEYILSCSAEENANIDYTSEFGESMTCGLSRFYTEMNRKILEEMGGKKG